MKYIKRLIPILSTLGIASIAITSCQNDPGDGYVAIPTGKLNIEDANLKGFIDEYANLDGYTKLTIGSSITNVDGFNYDIEGKIAFNAITKIDFETRTVGVKIEDQAFTRLPELKLLQFPANCRLIELSENSFLSCSKLDTIDFSKVTDGFSIYFSSVKWAYNLPTKGTFYANNDNKTTIESIRSILELTEDNWPIVVK